MRLLVAITTGRRVFRNTLNMVAANIARYGHTEDHFIGCLINYDTEYSGLNDTEFKYDETEVFQEVLGLGPADAIDSRNSWIRRGVPSNVAETLLPISGFGNRRNLIILEAICRGYDVILFWDDDEYPVACIRQGSQISWVSTDIIGAHLCIGCENADVTSGFRTGFALPIVSSVYKKLSANTLGALAQALSIGTEFIEPEFLMEPKKSFLVPTEIPSSVEIREESGGKWVSAGNLSIRTTGILSGTIPPFYIPFGGRGEDTIFSLKLRDAKVRRVPSGIFHDCFLEHTEILNGEYPRTIDPIVLGDHHLYRFSNALKGWFSYSPLLLWLLDRDAYADRLRQMDDKLRFVDQRLEAEYPQLASSLGVRLSVVLERAMARKDTEYTRLIQAYDVWPSILALV